jgi:predicted nucleic acid-binding Zn ribbon protein
MTSTGKRYSKAPRRISFIVDEVCTRFGLDDAREQYRAFHLWRELVGETIAAETAVERLSGGQLFVRVKNSVWRMELHFRRQELARKLNSAFGRDIVKEIIFR